MPELLGQTRFVLDDDETSCGSGGGRGARRPLPRRRSPRHARAEPMRPGESSWQGRRALPDRRFRPGRVRCLGWRRRPRQQPGQLVAPPGRGPRAPPGGRRAASRRPRQASPAPVPSRRHARGVGPPGSLDRFRPLADHRRCRPFSPRAAPGSRTSAAGAADLGLAGAGLRAPSFGSADGAGAPGGARAPLATVGTACERRGVGLSLGGRWCAYS